MSDPIYIEEYNNMYGPNYPWMISVQLVDDRNRVYSFSYLATEASYLLQDRMVYHINNDRVVRIPSSRIYDQSQVKLFARIVSDLPGQSRTVEADEYMPLRELGPDDLLDLFDEKIQSNEQVTFFDIHWGIYIKPTSIMFGNGRTRLQQGQPAGSFTPSFLAEKDCAAAAIVSGFSICMGRTSEYGDYGDYKLWMRSPVPRSFGKMVAKLRLAFGWGPGKVASIDEMVEAVNKTWPKLRLVIVHGSFRTCSRFPGEEYIEEIDTMDRSNQRSIYVLHYNDHFTCLLNPIAYFKGLAANTRLRWCVPCCQVYDHRTVQHQCIKQGQVKKTKKPRVYPKCDTCDGEIYGVKKLHVCGSQYCITCKLQIPREEYKLHRCSINEQLSKSDTMAWEGQVLTTPKSTEEEEEEEEEEDEDEEGEKKEYQGEVWAYDFECAIEWSDETFDIAGVVTDEQEVEETTEYGPHNLKTRGKVIIRHRKIAHHRPVMVIAKQVFKQGGFKTFTTASDFFMFVISRPSKSVWYAHNGSGYDTRLIYEVATKLGHIPSECTFNGNKIMMLEFGGQHKFLDTLLHLMGSLSSLAKAFDLKVKKGYFPHLANTTTRPPFQPGDKIPPLEDFGYSSIRNKAAQDQLKEWHDEQVELDNDWDLQKEMISYCKNDVDILAQLLEQYDTICRGISGGITSMGVVTSAGYTHKVFKRMYLQPYVAQWNTWQERVKHSWPVLECEEYFFAQAALRGGRTQTHQKQTLPRRGEKLVSIDVNSQYPGVQVNCDFPVGVPLIYINSPECYPCFTHYKDIRGCTCTLEYRQRRVNKKLDIKDATMNDGSFDWTGRFGFGIFDVTFPDRQYHPTLGRFDAGKKKCLFSLEPMVKQCLFSEELARAVIRGAVVTKCWAFHEYKRAPSLWKQFTKDTFHLKLVNSDPPSQDACDRYWNEHQIKVEPKDCKKNNSKRMIAKILCNSAWGKNAENPDKPDTGHFDYDNMHKYCELVDRHCKKEIKLGNQYMIHDKMIIAKYSSVYKGHIRPKHDKAFIAPAVCVPAYGRLQLEDIMHQFGRRVHMNDTDSIHLALDASMDLSGVVPKDPIIGEFEFENKLLPEFVKGTPKTLQNVEGYKEKLMAGSKSYMTIYQDDSATLKFKGVCVTDKDGYIAPKLDAILNPTTFRDVVLKGKTIIVPTMNFHWDPRLGGIKTIDGVKKMRSTSGKGQQVGNYTYPYGYAVTDEEEFEGDYWVQSLFK